MSEQRLQTHFKPKTGSDRVAYYMTRLLRFFADKFFCPALWSSCCRARNRRCGTWNGGWSPTAFEINTTN